MATVSGTAAGSSRSRAWSGWVAFAAWLMLIIGAVDFFEGLIAVIRGQYYVLTADQVIVFDVKTWGWLMMAWGIILALAGFSLLVRAGWARWFTILVCSVNVLGQLGFVGAAQYPLWALTAIALNVTVLYALIVRWDEASAID
jgi:hypothetical protein